MSSRAARTRSASMPTRRRKRRATPPDPESRAKRRRSEEHTSELQSLKRISYAVFCVKKKKTLQTPYQVIESTHCIEKIGIYNIKLERHLGLLCYIHVKRIVHQNNHFHSSNS